MVNDTQITVIGNLTADPELRYSQSGTPVVNFTIASTPRTYDRQSNEWKDGEALFLRASAWRELAENVAQSLHKGERVLAIGNLKQRSYTTKEGEKRTSYELDVTEIGPALRFVTAQLTRSGQGGGGQQQGGWGNQPQTSQPWGQQQQGQQGDGWAQPGQGAGWGGQQQQPAANSGGFTDEPPF